jgi:hypothetical protein
MLDQCLLSLMENHDKKVMVCSFERTNERLIRDFAHLRMRGAGGEANQEEAFNFLLTRLFPVPYSDFNNDRELISKYVEENVDNFDVVVFDPYQNFWKKSDNEFTNVNDVSGMCVNICRKHGKAVWLVAHPGTDKKMDGKSLTMHSVSGGGPFSNQCDNMFAFWRIGSQNYLKVLKIKRQELDPLPERIYEFTYDTTLRRFRKY